MTQLNRSVGNDWNDFNLVRSNWGQLRLPRLVGSSHQNGEDWLGPELLAEDLGHFKVSNVRFLLRFQELHHCPLAMRKKKKAPIGGQRKWTWVLQHATLAGSKKKTGAWNDVCQFNCQTTREWPVQQELWGRRILRPSHRELRWVSALFGSNRIDFSFRRLRLLCSGFPALRGRLTFAGQTSHSGDGWTLAHLTAQSFLQIVWYTAQLLQSWLNWWGRVGHEPVEPWGFQHAWNESYISTFQHLRAFSTSQLYIPSRELTYPAWGKGKSSSKCL